MVAEKEDKIKISSAKKAYQIGQKRSSFTEALTLGYTPLILIISNIAIALGTAAFVAWLLPHMPWAFPKMALFAVVGAIAAMYIPSRWNFIFQTIGHVKRLPKYGKQAELSKDQMSWMKAKMRYYIFTNISLVVVGALIMLSVHGTLIYIMLAAFSDSDLMEQLNIEGGEDAYIVLGFGMELVSAFVDLFLGFNATVRVDVKQFFPDLDEVDDLIHKKEEYEVLQKRIERLKKKEEKKEENKNRRTRKTTNNNSNQGKEEKNKQKQAAWEISKPDAKLEDISGFNKNSDILKEAMKGTTFDPKKFEEALNKVSESQRNSRITKKIAKEVRALKNLYAQGSNEDNWEKNSEAIWRDVQSSVKNISHIAKSMGYEIYKK